MLVFTENNIFADGNGIAEEIDKYVLDGEEIALVFDREDNEIERYLHGVGIDEVIAVELEPDTVYWSLADQLGSVRVLLDNTGETVNQISYDAFGNITNQSDPTIDPRFTYTGRELDSETGNYYYRSRYYNPASGRFLNEDLIGFAGGDTNLYRYVNNSPTLYTDPYGESIWDTVRNAALDTALNSSKKLTASLAEIIVEHNLDRLDTKFADGLVDLVNESDVAYGVVKSADKLTTGLANLVSKSDLAYDTLNVLDQGSAGLANFWTRGRSNQWRENLYGEIATRNHDGWIYQAGEATGGAIALGLGLLTGSAAVNGTVISGSLGFGTLSAIGYQAFTTGQGAYDSTRNYIEGTATAWDLLSFMDLYGVGLGRLSKVKPVANALEGLGNVTRGTADDIGRGVGRVWSRLRGGSRNLDEAGDVAQGISRNIDNVAEQAGRQADEVGDIAANGSRNASKGVDADDVIGEVVCFVAGTLIATPIGFVPIEEIQVGNKVYGGTKEYPGGIFKVRQLYQRQVEKVLDIVVNGVTITCTPEHPFWVEGYGWVVAEDLEPGYWLLTKDSLNLPINSVTWRECETTVYNFEMDEYHTYYVSELAILSHNRCIGHLQPTDNIDDQFLDELIEEAQAIRQHYIDNDLFNTKHAENMSFAVGQSVHNLNGAKKIVVTTSNGNFDQRFKAFLEKTKITHTDGIEYDFRNRKGNAYEVVRAIDFSPNPRIGWHAEGRMLEWGFMNNYTTEAIGVHQEMCLVCSNYVKTYGVRTNNGMKPPSYKKFPKKIPGTRPNSFKRGWNGVDIPPLDSMGRIID